MDTQLVEKIVHEVKSQGVFDEFRKDSMADVDTKPAYQNLRQRVDNTVKKFLSEQKWTPDTNKNQLREKLRRHIAESGFLDVGVERIVDQVVNPKIGSVFQPRIEEIAYNYLGLPPPPKIHEPPPPPLMHPLPPLPLTAPPPPLKVETESCSMLPNDLEQVSPDSDKATVKSEIDGDDKTEVDMDTEEKIIDDEDESPPFEPIVKTEPDDTEVKHDVLKIKAEVDEATLEDTFKKEDENSNATVKTEVKEYNESQGSNNFPSVNLDKDVSHSMDCRNSQDSQLSSVSSDTRLSPVTKDDSILRSSQEEAVTANISEEAQMPKFNENSSELYGMNGNHEVDSELHFDIKKDEIKFEGTERKSKLDDSHESPLPEEIKCPLSAESASLDNKNDTFKFSSNNNSNMEQREDDLQRTPNAQELSFGSSIDDSTSIPTNTTSQVITEDKEKELSIDEKSPQLSTPKQQLTSTPTPTPTPTATPTATPTPPPPFSQTPTATPSPVSTQKTEKEHHTARHSSSSSSSRHKKHSKERRRSPDREKDKDRYRSSTESKHRSSSGSGSKNSSSKHSSSSSSKYSSSSSHNKSSNEKDLEKSSSSSHSSSKQAKHSSSDKRHHSSSSAHRDHSSSSSNTSSKRNERKDDHQEAKPKPQRRKSTDSNDDDGDKGGAGVGKSSTQNNKSSTSNSRLKSKSANEVNQSPSNKNNDTQKESTENEGTLDKLQLHNNVVILNDILENPQTQFIHLDTRGHMIGVPLQPPTTMNNYHNAPRESDDDLLYFEDMQKTFAERIHFLNDTMDFCRRAVNSLRFETPVDEGIEVSSEDDYNHITSVSLSSLSESLKRKSNINYEDFEKTPRKRCLLNKSEDIALKTSPTPSDISVSSKENEEIDKNTDLSKKLDRHKAAVQKLSQQQRYSSDDLYKPRPILGQRSRRRGMDSVV